jgi:hypothetical protein
MRLKQEYFYWKTKNHRAWTILSRELGESSKEKKEKDKNQVEKKNEIQKKKLKGV